MFCLQPKFGIHSPDIVLEYRVLTREVKACTQNIDKLTSVIVGNTYYILKHKDYRRSFIYIYLQTIS